MRWNDGHSAARAIAALLLAVALIMLITSWDEVVSTPAPRTDDGVLEQALLIAPVVIALRVAVIGLAVYLLASVIGLALEGRWLVKAGPTGAEAGPDPGVPDVLMANLDLEGRVTDLEGSVDGLWDAIVDLEDHFSDEEGDG